MELGKYSFGIGDRFGQQGPAQLAAIIRAREQGIEITPVWNKSEREHRIIGSVPADTRSEAEAAVAECGWRGSYFVDADHIGLHNIEAFVECSDFFTIDVAEFIAKRAEADEIEAFVGKYKGLTGRLQIEALEGSWEVTEAQLRAIAGKYLLAVKQAGRIYRRIAEAKQAGSVVIEVSMDETDEPQSPVELLFILAAIADEGIPVATIAPKFCGRFNKGVDYVGDVEQFAREFCADLAVVRFAVEQFGLPAGLKLSVHSGSDKFSLYPVIHEALRRFDAGLHVKTAGTTWLQELAGLAVAGPEGLEIAREVYIDALKRIDELIEPYETVVDIDRENLPSAEQVLRWDGREFAAALQHEPGCTRYNRDFRQLLHIAYKIAAEMGQRYVEAVRRYEAVIGPGVTENLYERHIRPIFIG